MRQQVLLTIVYYGLYMKTCGEGSYSVVNQITGASKSNINHLVHQIQQLILGFWNVTITPNTTTGMGHRDTSSVHTEHVQCRTEHTHTHVCTHVFGIPYFLTSQTSSFYLSFN